MRALIGMLKHTNLSKEQVIAICGSLPTEECSDEIAELLIQNKNKLKTIPRQEMMNMCGRVIEKHGIKAEENEKIVRELIRELINRGMDEAAIRSVFSGLDTVEQYQQLTDWLREVNNPTKNDIMLKVYLLTEGEEGE